MSVAERSPVVFIHGLWLHASSWDPWIARFREAGYAASAPPWPGDGATVDDTRRNPNSVAGHGIADVVDHYAKHIATLGRKPVVIGHSFGGLIAQRLLGDGHASAAVAIDPAPIKGVKFLPLSAFRVASVALRNPLGKNHAVSLTQSQFRYGFGNAISERESNELYERWTIPSPAKPLFEAASAAFARHSAAKVEMRSGVRGPLLITAGGRDHTVPTTISKQTAKLYRHSNGTVELKEFPDRGHSLTIDSGWPEVADTVIEWLTRQSV
jgi:pimeloyl-ACP methyl ester carboxylesterase